MEEPTLDIASILAAVVLEAGGEVVIQLDTLSNLDPDTMALAIDPSEDEKGLSIRLVVPPEELNE